MTLIFNIILQLQCTYKISPTSCYTVFYQHSFRQNCRVYLFKNLQFCLDQDRCAFYTINYIVVCYFLNQQNFVFIWHLSSECEWSQLSTTSYLLLIQETVNYLPQYAIHSISYIVMYFDQKCVFRLSSFFRVEPRFSCVATLLHSISLQ